VEPPCLLAPLQSEGEQQRDQERARDDQVADDRRNQERGEQHGGKKLQRKNRIPATHSAGKRNRADASGPHAPFPPTHEQQDPIIVRGIEPVDGREAHFGDEPPIPPAPPSLDVDARVVAEARGAGELDGLLQIADGEVARGLFAFVLGGSVFFAAQHDSKVRLRP
jgi:hypothetical protein